MTAESALVSLPLLEQLEPRLLLSGDDVLSPTVLGVAVNGGDAQRSMVRSIAVQFSEDCSSLNANSLVIQNADTGEQVALDDMAMSYDTETNTATWTFPGFSGGTLANGNYFATVRSAAVTDAAGNYLDGNGDGIGGDDCVTGFYRFFGDADGDRDVDFSDLFAFRQTYLQTSSSETYNPMCDGDCDGDVDFSDLFKFRVNYLQSLTPVVTIAAVDDAAVEGVSGAVFRFFRTDTRGDLVLSYTIGGTADSSDYSEALVGTVTISDGNTCADIMITPVDDGVSDNSQTLTLTMPRST